MQKPANPGNKRFGIVAVGGALTLLGALAFWTLRVPLQMGSKPHPIATQEQPHSEPTSKPSVVHANSEPQTSSQINSSVSAVTQCMQESDSRSKAVIEAIVKNPRSLEALSHEQKELRLRNILYTQADGEKRRLHLFVDENSAGKPVQRMRYFKEDAEELPEALELPPADQVNPTEETVQKYISDGKVTMTESTWVMNSKSLGRAEWTERNGLLKELHYVNSYGTLGCARGEESGAVECQCRHY